MKKRKIKQTMKTALRALFIIAIAAMICATPVMAEEKLTVPEIREVLVNYLGWESPGLHVMQVSVERVSP